MNVLVLGAGQMGLGAAYDLIHCPDVTAVTVADVDESRLRVLSTRLSSPKLTTVQADVTRPEGARALMRGHQAAIGCVSYRANLLLTQAAIETRTHFCDLGGNNAVVDAQLALDAQAREAGVHIIPDCGLAPGMVSLISAHGISQLDQVDSVQIRVGGLPRDPQPPMNYQIVFSVEGLVNEYIEPCRVLRGGQIVEVPGMSELESLEFPAPFGQMEAFQTSGGSSTLPDTYLGQVKNLDYKTIRYPGHCEQIRLLMALGLTSSEPLSVDGVNLPPRRMLENLLWKRLPTGAPDVILLRVTVHGEKDGQAAGLEYTLIDHFDPASGLSAMMRTTAFPAAIIAVMMARGELKEAGARPQERCVPAGHFLAELARRGLILEQRWL